ncbi:MAG: L-aspartate oxidase [Aquificae bacterium]|nr:L-aspartate oxidase [Aquificota bacterium]
MLLFRPARFERLRREVVVVGEGIAGLTAAIRLAEGGVRPLVVSKGRGTTYLSQGGIAAAVSPHDSPVLHYLDTLRAGRFLNDEEVVRLVVFSGKGAVLRLLEWGVPFDRGEEFFELALEAAHSTRRILKVRDYTGRAIYEALKRRALNLGVEFLEGELLEVLTAEGKAAGALFKVEGGFLLVESKLLFLATGGAAGLYAKSSAAGTGGAEALGAAARAGALLRDCEFVQFHPTVLKGSGRLISEAVRGEGAVLTDGRGERFVDELAPRDEVARAIFSRLVGGGEVFLDLRPLAARGVKIEERFPQVFQILKEAGLDPYREPVPVEPAAHYFIGGLAVDADGKTSLDRLYAVGESAATGLHGANRLASNSLLEGVVFGLRAAEDALFRLPFERFLRPELEPSKSSREAGFDFEKRVRELGELLWQKAGIVRSGEGLREALLRLDELLEESFAAAGGSPEAKRFFDLALVAKAVVLSALRREESRGCHYREDFPLEREPFRKVRFEVRAEELFKISQP